MTHENVTWPILAPRLAEWLSIFSQGWRKEERTRVFSISREMLRENDENDLAEREGFEPSVEFPLHTLSKRARSTTPTSLRFRINELRTVRISVTQNPPSIPSVLPSGLESAAYKTHINS